MNRVRSLTDLDTHLAHEKLHLSLTRVRLRFLIMLPCAYLRFATPANAALDALRARGHVLLSHANFDVARRRCRPEVLRGHISIHQ